MHPDTSRQLAAERLADFHRQAEACALAARIRRHGSVAFARQRAWLHRPLADRPRANADRSLLPGKVRKQLL
jgi:hypothetical protein